MRVHVIGEENAVVGLGLLGITGDVATTPEAGRAALDRALRDPDIGILLVTADVAQMMREELNDLKVRRLEPLIVEIPASSEKAPVINLRALVQEALGVHLGG